MLLTAHFVRAIFPSITPAAREIDAMWPLQSSKPEQLMAKEKSKDKGENKNQVTLSVIVNGQPTDVTANVNAPLHTIIPEALKQTNNVGQPPENWELKDAAGNVLDGNRKIEDFGFTKETKLFLGLKAGIAGE